MILHPGIPRKSTELAGPVGWGHSSCPPNPQPGIPFLPRACACAFLSNHGRCAGETRRHRPISDNHVVFRLSSSCSTSFERTVAEPDTSPSCAACRTFGSEDKVDNGAWWRFTYHQQRFISRGRRWRKSGEDCGGREPKKQKRQRKIDSARWWRGRRSVPKPNRRAKFLPCHLFPHSVARSSRPPVFRQYRPVLSAVSLSIVCRNTGHAGPMWSA